MFVNESINICEATRSTISLLELGKIEGIVTGIGLAIIASIGLAIKALFVWYIQYRAPKDRPINTLIWYDQVRIIYLSYSELQTVFELGHYNSSYSNLFWGYPA